MWLYPRGNGWFQFIIHHFLFNLVSVRLSIGALQLIFVWYPVECGNWICYFDVIDFHCATRPSYQLQQRKHFHPNFGKDLNTCWTHCTMQQIQTPKRRPPSPHHRLSIRSKSELEILHFGIHRKWKKCICKE